MTFNTWLLIISMSVSLIIILFQRPLARLIARLFPAAGALSPDRITLVPVERLNWPDQEAAHRLFQELTGFGFVNIGAFRVPEIKRVELVGFYHREESCYAVLYHHPMAGMWTDISCRYMDGGSLDVTDSPNAGVLDKPANQVTVAVKGGRQAELWSRFLAYRHPGQRRPVSADGFKPDFEKDYAEETAWRRNKGGVSEDEIRRVAANAGMTPSERDIKTVADMEKARARKKGQ